MVHRARALLLNHVLKAFLKNCSAPDSVGHLLDRDDKVNGTPLCKAVLVLLVLQASYEFVFVHMVVEIKIKLTNV